MLLERPPEIVERAPVLERVAHDIRLAREYGFLASCGSDFHGPGESYIDLGQLAPLPIDLVPVWEAF